MSILINMEMPKCCGECNFDAGGYCLAKSSNFLDWCEVNDRPKPTWCPLIELPPHGRLIHGEWEHKQFCSNMSGYEYACFCSICDKPTYRISLLERMPNFCPNCGADMREAESEDD